jgi:hypothetical protein
MAATVRTPRFSGDSDCLLESCDFLETADLFTGPFGVVIVNDFQQQAIDIAVVLQADLLGAATISQYHWG